MDVFVCVRQHLKKHDNIKYTEFQYIKQKQQTIREKYYKKYENMKIKDQLNVVRTSHVCTHTYKTKICSHALRFGFCI